MSTLKVNTIDAHSGSLLTIDSTADLAVASATSATSSTTGALKVTGGISTQENLYVGGNAVITGTMTANGGTITLGDAGTDNVTIGGEINSDIIPDATNTYDLGSSSKKWAEIHATDFTGALTGNVTGNTSGSAGSCTGNSATASAWASARTLALTGAVTGSASVDGTGNVSMATTATADPTITLGGDLTGNVTLTNLGNGTLTATVVDDSHNHVISNVDGLQAALDLKATLASPTLTGTPLAPTAAANTNTTQVATTAYVQTELTDLIGGAPGTLDTLNELAFAINDDASYASTLTTALATKTAKTSNQSLGSAADAMTISGHTITLARGDGTTDAVTVPDNNTTYSVGDGGLTTNDFTNADHSKLNAIEASADVTDTTNVTAAGALMDSELAGLAAVKATTGTFLTADQSKLDGIASSATNVTNNNQITNGAGYITSYTNTTYSAGAGMDLSGTTFSVEPDLRDSITHIGLDSGDYIGWTNNSHQSFFVNAGERVRIEADGDIHADGDVIAYSTTISDERLKTGIMPITDALAKVNQLNGCTFTYLADGKKSAGLIAQEVEKVLPSAVTNKKLPLKVDDDKEYKVLQYDQTIGLLVEAIKELSDKIEKLENK